ncbi:AMP-binding protein [Actinoplanes sp. CA-054009]
MVYQNGSMWPPAALRPAPGTVHNHRRDGLWRSETLLDDLRRHRDAIPDETAVIAHRSGAGRQQLSWAEYAARVEQFASALSALGVRRGDVVAMQLPNWWETTTLLLACLRVGAVAAPFTTSIRPRELERMLARVEATVMITVAEWDGHDLAGDLAAIAGRLPRLRHRVVLGREAGAGEVGFEDHFLRTSWAADHAMPLDTAVADPDQVALVLFTSGTTGEPKAVLHTSNTLHAVVATQLAVESAGPGDVTFNPHNVTHVFGFTTSVVLSVTGGITAVLLDVWSPAAAAELVRDTRTTILCGAAVFIDALVKAAKDAEVDLSSLRVLLSGGAPVPPVLVHEVFRELGVPLRAGWGMTEVPSGTWTRAGDPPQWAASSDGRPGPALELDLRAEGAESRENPSRLYVRGAGLCLAVVGRDSGTVEVLADRDDGWFDTGDLVVRDGAGGIRLVGRDADRIGSGFMIPVVDVEAQLLTHPAITDVAVVGYLDGDGHESACAVITAAGPAPGVAEVRAFLTGLAMTDWYQPTRVEVLDVLPRNVNGKVLKRRLRQWLQEAGPTP